jgi:hypothetical protein
MLRNNYTGVRLKHRPELFRSESLAVICAEQMKKPHRAVKVDRGYLVVCNSDAMRLVRAGYTLVA